MAAHEPTLKFYKTERFYQVRCDCGFSAAAKTQKQAEDQADFHRKTKR